MLAYSCIEQVLQIEQALVNILELKISIYLRAYTTFEICRFENIFVCSY